MTLELDRIEGKIQALAEIAVNRQDPDFLSSQVDSAAESMRQTEKAVTELQHLTGLADQLEEPPAILESDLRECSANDRLSPISATSPLPDWFPGWAGSWPTCTSPAPQPRSSCTATPTISSGRRPTSHRDTARSPSFSPSSCSAAGRWCCTTTSAGPARFRRAANETRLKDMVLLANRKIGDLSALAKDPGPALAIIDRFVRNNIMAADADRVSFALLLESGIVRLSRRRAGPPQPAGVVPTGDIAQLGVEPARQAAQYGVRPDRREAERI